MLGLRTDCCPDPEPGAASKRHLIRGHEYKTATDEDGNHISAGVERDVPWVAIAPVVNAIRVLERMVPDGALLFHAPAHDLPRARSTITGAIKLDAMRDRIERFVAWANNLATAHDLPQEIIPPDSEGNIGAGRFQRTLAWHIARRPGGLIALAVQYGHMRAAVSGGYASRGRGGIHELLDLETVRAVADTVADLRDGLEVGGGVSGPAARHAIKTATSGPFFAGVTVNATTARRLAANEDVMLYGGFAQGQVVSVFGCLSRERRVGHGAMDRWAVLGFCTQLLRTITRRIFLVVDGSSIHSAAAVGCFVARTGGRLHLFFLPAYAPELNPNEWVNQRTSGPRWPARRWPMSTSWPRPCIAACASCKSAPTSFVPSSPALT